MSAQMRLLAWRALPCLHAPSKSFKWAAMTKELNTLLTYMIVSLVSQPSRPRMASQSKRWVFCPYLIIRTVFGRHGLVCVLCGVVSIQQSVRCWVDNTTAKIGWLARESITNMINLFKGVVF
eukprot:360037-Amphidinium_carterae.1